MSRLDSVPEKTPGKKLQCMSNRMSENMSDRIPTIMSKNVSDKLSVDGDQ